MRPTYFTLLLFLGSILHAQIQIIGKITDGEFNDPLPYVNIGIPNAGIGTVSDEEGYFLLDIPANLIQKELRFSMVGFAPQSFPINRIAGPNEKLLNVVLKPETTALAEVVVTSGAWEIKKVGNETESKLITTGFTSNRLGNEIAQFVRVKKQRPTRIQRFWLSIAENTIESVILRLNIYLEEEGFPGTNVLQKPIYIELPNEPQTIEVDLTPYDIYIEDDFFVSIEWIEDLGVEGLWFSAGVFGKSLYARSTSHDQWVKQRGLSIGMGVEVLQKN
ncbi:MAG: carboxypeptidase-like regulatory domain-containing protein [Flavobacteriaceae bacterium]